MNTAGNFLRILGVRRLRCAFGLFILLVAQPISADVIWTNDLINSRVQKSSLAGTSLKRVSAFYPSEMTGDSFGNLFVGTAKKEILKLSPAGGVLKKFWFGDAQIGDIVGPMACDNAGNLYVTNWGRNTLHKFSATGAYLGIASYTGIANPTAMAADADGYMYVANITGIRKFSPQGVDLGDFVSGIFSASAIACDKNRDVYIAIPGVNIRKYSTSGTVIGTFARPALSVSGLAFDSRGNLYASNGGNNAVEKFSSEGASLGFVPLDGVGLAWDIVISGSYENYAGAFAGAFDDQTGALDLTVTKTGSFSGKIRFQAQAALSIAGVFDGRGYFNGSFAKGATAVTFQLTFPGDDAGSWHMKGTIKGKDITAYHAAYLPGATVAELGKYTLLLASRQGPPAPQGSGYGTLTVSKTGMVAISGKLSDHTSYTAAGPVIGSAIGANYFLLCNSALYSSKGLLLGQMILIESGDINCVGTFVWNKPQTTGALGVPFNTTMTGIGSFFVPVRNQSVLSVTDVTVEITDGDLPARVELVGTIGTNNQISISGSNSLQFKGSFNGASGILTGSFLHPVSNRRITCQGIAVQILSDPWGGGYFIGPPLLGQSKGGSINIDPR